VLKARVAARAWADGLGKALITLMGPPGTGKSHLAKAAYVNITQRGETVFYMTEGDLIKELHRAVGDSTLSRFLDDLQAVPWLIIDDVGTQAMSPWAKGNFDHIINARWESFGATRTFFTTNLAGKDLPPRVASRIADTMRAEVITIKATDYRMTRGADSN